METAACGGQREKLSVYKAPSHGLWSQDSVGGRGVEAQVGTVLRGPGGPWQGIFSLFLNLCL